MEDLTLTIGDFIVLFGVFTGGIGILITVLALYLGRKDRRQQQERSEDLNQQQKEIARRENEVKSFTLIEQQIAKIMESMSRIEIKLDSSVDSLKVLERDFGVLDNKVENLHKRQDKMEEYCLKVQDNKRRRELG